MTTVAPVSYEHPRRPRPFLLSENRNGRVNEGCGGDSRSAYFEESLSRLETNLTEKMNSLFTRMEKCSDLSVASSRAVAALSAQFEDHKAETEQRLSVLTSSMNELRGSMNRLCSESQNLTMTALEECCNELVKQIKTNSEGIVKMGESLAKVQEDTRVTSARMETDVEQIRDDFTGISRKFEEARKASTGISEEMRIVAEEAVNTGLEDLNRKFTKDLETFDLDWKDYRENLDQRFNSADKKVSTIEKTLSSRYDDLKSMFDDRMRSEIDVRVKETLIPNAVNKVRRDMDSELEEIRRILHAFPKAPEIPESAIRNITHEISQMQSALSSFTSATVPTLYREIELKIAGCEHTSQQRCLDLLKEFATEVEFDIDRMIELIHSVFVQAHLPMPTGTSTSWHRFKEVMFDRENIGGVRVRRPILSEQRPSSRLSSRRTGRY